MIVPRRRLAVQSSKEIAQKADLKQGGPVKMFTWIAVVLLFIVGSIHVYEAPDSFHDAAYKGWLFYANGVASMLAVYGICRGRRWGWYLGLAVSAGSFLAYIASRTVGLPLIAAEPDAWFEPLGIAAFLAEGAFIAVFATRAIK